MAPITTWLYRVLEMDDDGDPLDFGAVNAASFIEAQELVAAHLDDVCGEDCWEDVMVRFYSVTKTTGVYETSDFVDVARSALWRDL